LKKKAIIGGKNMELMQQEIRWQFLNSIMKENKVSLKSISDCMVQNQNIIDNIIKIFESDDTQSVKKRLVLLKLISRTHAQENYTYYQRKYNVDDCLESDIETYKTLLIAALMDNVEFYVRACNWCGLIQREVSRDKAKDLDSEGNVLSVSAHDSIFIVYGIRIPFWANFYRRSMPKSSILTKENCEFDTEIEKYEEVLQSNPNDYDTCIKLASLYINRGRDGDDNKAIEYSNRVLAVKHNDPSALFTRGVACSQKNIDNEKALNDLETILGTNTQVNKAIYYVMGTIYYKEGKIKDAQEAFEAVIAIDPDFADIKQVLEELQD